MPDLTRFSFFSFAVLLIGGTALLAASALAIQPERWTHSTESDFEAGEFDGLVVTNLGDLKLAAATRALAELPEDVTFINDLETIGDVTYLAVGPAARILKLEDDELSEVASVESAQIFALTQVKGTLVVGTSGDAATLWALVEGSLKPICPFPQRQYVWDLLLVDDALWAATGPEGEVIKLNGIAGMIDTLAEGGQDATQDPEFDVVLDTAQANILCLAATPDGHVYAGTDTDGLIYRLADGESYVVYDADEPEIGALLVAADGTVYVGTADAEQAKPGRLETAAEDEAGRPDGETVVIEVVTEDSPDAPELPTDPEPQPLQTDQPETSGDAETAPRDTAETAKSDQSTIDQNKQSTENSDTASVNPAAAAPTAEQYDAVRDEVRKRLLAARRTAPWPKASRTPARDPPRTPPPPRAATNPATPSTTSIVRVLSPKSFAIRSWCSSLPSAPMARSWSGPAARVSSI